MNSTKRKLKSKRNRFVVIEPINRIGTSKARQIWSQLTDFLKIHKTVKWFGGQQFEMANSEKRNGWQIDEILDM